jgi:hypothetical protein
MISKPQPQLQIGHSIVHLLQEPKLSDLVECLNACVPIGEIHSRIELRHRRQCWVESQSALCARFNGKTSLSRS